MKAILISLIRGYQWTLTSVLGPRCRFYPSCSAYAAEAIEMHGVGKGSVLAIKRFTSCHPFHPGGYDPVPGPGPEATDQAMHSTHADLATKEGN